MSLINEIEKFMTDNLSSVNYRIINLGGKSLYIEGIKSVISFGSNEMQFQLKKGLLKVFGSDMSVKYLDKTTCVIIGSINSVEVV